MSSKSKPEFTGYRDLCYNVWHRSLGKDYFMIDIDVVESRKDRGIVAIMERTVFNRNGNFSIEDILNFKRYQLIVTSEIAKRMNVPAYLILYEKANSDESEPWKKCEKQCNLCKFQPINFHVFQVQNGEATFYKELNQNEYAQFIKNL